MKLFLHLSLFVLITVSTASTQLAFSSPGDLDSSFGINGSVTTQICTSKSQADAVALTNDGSIVVVGVCDGLGTNRDFAIVKYTANGSVDTSFGNNGLYRIDYDTDIDWATAVEIQADNKIIVAGYGDIDSIANIALARLNPDGSLDATFGEGGLLITPTGAGNTYISAMAIDELDRIVVAGQTYNGADQDFVVARYLSDGTLDLTFATNGILGIPISDSNDQAYSVAIQPDGKIVMAGRSDNGSNRDIAIARVDESGKLDSSFDSDGIVVIDIASNEDFGYDLLVQPDGKIVVAGASHDGTKFKSCLIRVDEHGELDSSFGTGGVTTGSAYGYNEYAHSLAMQPDGKLVITGVSENVVGGNLPLYLSVARFTETGHLDASYGVGGYSLYEKIDYSQGNAIAIAPDGTLLVAGVTDYDLSLTRFIALDSDNNGIAEAWDVSPDAFKFSDIYNAEPNSMEISNIVSVSGLGENVYVPVVVSRGEYAINASATYHSTIGWVTNGDKLNVQHVSATTYETEVQTTLSIGGIRVNNSNDFIVGEKRSATFTSETRSAPSGGGGALSPIFLILFLLVRFHRDRVKSIRLDQLVVRSNH